MQHAIFTIVLFLPLLSSGVFVYDESLPPITYLHNREHQVVFLTNISPNLICLRQEHWMSWVYRTFCSQLFTINLSASVNSFPVHVFLAKNEQDMRSRTPWLKPKRRVSDLSTFSLLANFQSDASDSLDSFDVFENTQIPLSGMHSHCIALLPSPSNSLLPYKLKVGFDFQLDISRLTRLFVGLIMYGLASRLTNNIAFYYFSGVSVSVLGSFLILFLLGMRLFPKRTSLIMQGAVLLSGSAFSLLVFCFGYMRSALWNFATNNIKLLIVYTSIVASISAVFLYWFSVPESLLTRFPRTQTVLLLVLRLIGIFFITSAPHLPESIDGVDKLVVFMCGKLGLDVDVYGIFSFPLLIRLLFGILVALLLRSISPATKKDLGKKRHAFQEQPVTLIPCATSSPYPYHPQYAAYYGKNESLRRRGQDYSGYWDRQPISPMHPKSTSRGNFSPSFGYQSLTSRKMRSNGFTDNRTQDLLTDDEEEDY